MGFREAWKAQEERHQRVLQRNEERRAKVQGAKAIVQERHAALPFRLDGKLAVQDGQIIHGRDKHPLAGAHATVDTAGAIDKRVTATRLILTGPLAFGLRKKKDNRELFLLVEGDGFGFVVEVDAKKQKDAREFAVKLNAAAGRAAVPDVPDAPPTASEPSIPDQIRQLGELRDQGLLTSDEFEAKKAELLKRL
jgi:hypothetical protein